MQVPSDAQSSVPIEALEGSRAFAYEITAYQAITNSNEFDGGDFAFCGARMPLQLIDQKDVNGILGVEVCTHSSQIRFTVPVKPIFADIDVAAEVGRVKDVMNDFMTKSDDKLMHPLTSQVDGLYIGFSRRADEPVKATFQQQPKSTKTRVLSTTRDLMDDDDGFYRPMGHTSTTAAQSYELIYSNVIVKDCEKDIKYVVDFVHDLFKALAKMKVPSKHLAAVATLMGLSTDKIKLEHDYAKQEPKVAPKDKPEAPKDSKDSKPEPKEPKVEAEKPFVPRDAIARSPKRSRDEKTAEKTAVSFGEDDEDDGEEDVVQTKPKRGRPPKHRNEADV